MARWPRAEVQRFTGRSNALLDATGLPKVSIESLNGSFKSWVDAGTHTGVLLGQEFHELSFELWRVCRGRVGPKPVLALNGEALNQRFKAAIQHDAVGNATPNWN